jgi:hypothetical protein
MDEFGVANIGMTTISNSVKTRPAIAKSKHVDMGQTDDMTVEF